MWPQHLYIVLEIKQHIMWSTRLCCWKKHMSYKTIVCCLILLKNYVSYKKISCLLFVCLCNWRCKTRKSLLRLPPWARKPLGDMDLSNGFERPSSKGAKLLFPVIKANKINPLGPPFKLFQCNYVSYDIKWHIYIRVIFRWCTSRKEGQDSGGACATHIQSTRHKNPILLSANTWVVGGWRDDIDGEPRRTSVCVNNSQSLCHQLLKKGEGGAKLE